jgi:hypothetical protein
VTTALRELDARKPHGGIAAFADMGHFGRMPIRLGIRTCSTGDGRKLAT